ncbi:hypothetical protein DIPPA_19861 [Diplonema papillatum]|nr:hypothetical protein DIPPA_19861 [Diplonema papillatum]
MRLSVALFALLAALPGTVAQTVCDAGERVAVCLELGEDDWMTNITQACMAGADLETNITGEAETSNVTLQIHKDALSIYVYSVAPQLIVATCNNSEITFEIESAMGPAAGDLPSYISSLSHAFTLTVSSRLSGDADVLELAWYGEILTGQIDNIYTEFSIRKEKGAASSNFTVGLMTPGSESAPGLPAILDFVGDMIPLLTHDTSCPYTNLAPARATDNYEGPLLDLAEAPEPVVLEYGFFDPCLARRIAERNCTEDPDACTALNRDVVVTLTTIVREPVLYGGVFVENLDVHLQGTFVWQGGEVSTEDAVTDAVELEAGLTDAAEDLDEEGSGEGVLNGISWNGTMTADLRVFKNLVLFGSGEFVDDLIELEVEFVFGTATTAVDGSVMWISECTAANATTGAATETETEADAVEIKEPNSGSVNLTLSFVGKKIAGVATQQSCDEWLITSKVVGERISLWGRYLKSSTVAVSVTGSETDGVPGMNGTIVGPVEMGNFINATGTISFTGEAVESFNLVGSMNIDGFVNGSLVLSVEETASDIVGKANVTFSASNGVIPRLEATVKYSSSGNPLWTLTGQLSSLVLYDIEMTRVNVTLIGSPEDNQLNTTDTWSTTVTWSGVVEGTIVLDGSKIAVTVPIADNKFQDIEGQLRLVGRSMAFDGTFRLDETSNSTGCAGLSFDAVGSLLVVDYGFDASLVSHGCAGAGEALFTVTGSTDEGMVYHELALSKMTVELAAFGKECDDVSCDATDFLLGIGNSREVASWTGQITGNSPLFGGTSTASVAFREGQMGAVNVSTLFNTESQLLSGKLWVIHNSDCGEESLGEGEMKLRLAGAQPLNVSGLVSVVACTGEVKFQGVHDGVWRSASGFASKSELTMSLPENVAAPLTGLGARVWTGTLKSTALDDGTVTTMQLDTSQTATSFVATVQYTGRLVNVTGELSNTDGVCVGTASIFVGNLAHGLPSLEVEGGLEVEGCVEGNSWVATGTAASYIVPFLSRSLNLTNVRVTASRKDAGSPLVGSIRGTWRNDFFVTVGFNSDEPDAVRIVGGVVKGTKSITSFLTAWNSGAPALPAVLGTGSPGLFEDLRGMKLAAVEFELLFGTEEVVLTGSGSLYGAGFYATVVIRKQGKQWGYGIHASSQDKNGPVLARVADGMLGNVLTKLSPSEIVFAIGSTSLGSSGIEAKGVTFKSGLMLEVHLRSDNPLIQTVLAQSPAAMATRIEAVAEASGGYKLSAALSSASTVHVAASLEGDLQLGSSGATIVDLSLDLLFKSATGAPKLGFLATIRCPLASAPNNVEFTSSGFISLPTSVGETLKIETWSVTRPDPWVDAFGAAGINVLFGLKFSLKMTSALEPTEFSLVGQCEVAGTVSACTISAPMPDFTKPVVLAGAGVDLQFLVAELSDCPGCISAVGKVLSNVTMQSVAVTASVGTSSSVTVVVDGVQRLVPPGVVVQADVVRFWEVITMRRLEFEVTKTGVDQEFIAEPVRWGPITITSPVDAAKGPFLEFSLVEPSPQVRLNGVATIWGSTRSVNFEFYDKTKSGRFSVPLVGADPAASLDATIVVTSVPGQPTFNNTVEGVASVDLTKLSADATKWLLDLRTVAEKAVERNSSLLLEARVMQLLKTTIRSQEQVKWAEQLAAWTGRIQALVKKLRASKKACKVLKQTCNASKAPKACVQYTACLKQLAKRKVAKAAAEASKLASEKLAAEQMRIVDAQSTEANETVAKLENAVQLAKQLDDAFSNMTAAAGGDLADVAFVTSATFKSPLSPTFSALNVQVEATVLGKELLFEFQSDLKYTTLRTKLIKKLRAFLKSTWGAAAVSL